LFTGKPVPLSKILEKKNVDGKFFLGEDVSRWEYLKGRKRIPRVKPNGEAYIYSEGPVPFPDVVSRPGRTMLTSESSVNRSTHVVPDKVTGELRLLTPVECERLNEFPDGWTDTGMPDKYRYFVMGNALVTGIVTTLGETLIEWDSRK
jgi:DNA (cytosine-5)-methyltransferase 1